LTAWQQIWTCIHFPKEMSFFFSFRLLPSNAYSTDRSFLPFLAESNHVWLGIGYPSSFYPRGMTVCCLLDGQKSWTQE
jgi:hypothetical protein